MGQQVLRRRKGQMGLRGRGHSSEQPVQGLSRANKIKFIFKMLALAVMYWVESGIRTVSRERLKCKQYGGHAVVPEVDSQFSCGG